MSVDGKSEPVHISNMFMEHFKVRSPLGPLAALNGCMAESKCLGDESMVHFTAKQVQEAIKKMSGCKSPGQDGLSVEHLRYAGVHLPRVLALLFTIHNENYRGAHCEGQDWGYIGQGELPSHLSGHHNC